MKTEEVEALRRVAEAIGKHYPEVDVAYGESLSSHLNLYDEGILSLHVFNAPEDQYAEIYRHISEQVAAGVGAAYRRIAFCVWDEEQTEEAFQEEVRASRAQTTLAISRGALLQDMDCFLSKRPMSATTAWISPMSIQNPNDQWDDLTHNMPGSSDDSYVKAA